MWTSRLESCENGIWAVPCSNLTVGQYCLYLVSKARPCNECCLVFQPGVVGQMIEAAEERPWLWVVYILTVALPVFLVILFCCSGKVWVVVGLFCFILIHSYHVKNNQDILPEVFLCSSSVMTGPHLVLTSETLFTIFSGHVLCPDGSRIVSPSVASLVYCTPSHLAAVFWKKRRKKKKTT